MTNKNKQKPQSTNLIILFSLAIILLVIFYFVWQFFIGSQRIPDLLEETKFPEADLIFRDSGAYGGNTQRTNYVYWVDANIADVRDHYEMLDTYFGDSISEYGTWLIGLYDSNINSDADLESAGESTTHHSLCNRTEYEVCITIALVDASQEQYWQLSVVSPSSFRYTDPPFAIRNNGTLIIYSYTELDY